MRKDLNLNNKKNQKEILDQYLDSLEKIKNYSPNTIKSYKNDILQYLDEEVVLGEFSKYLKNLYFDDVLDQFKRSCFSSAQNPRMSKINLNLKNADKIGITIPGI